MVLQHLKICMGLWVKEFMFSSPLPAKQYFNFLYFHLFFLTEKEKETKRKKICRSVHLHLSVHPSPSAFPVFQFVHSFLQNLSQVSPMEGFPPKYFSSTCPRRIQKWLCIFPGQPGSILYPSAKQKIQERKETPQTGEDTAKGRKFTWTYIKKVNT